MTISRDQAERLAVLLRTMHDCVSRGPLSDDLDRLKLYMAAYEEAMEILPPAVDSPGPTGPTESPIWCR